jgi:hypothetical protein
VSGRAQHGYMEKEPRRTAEREALIREIQRYLAVVTAFRTDGRRLTAARSNKGEERA